MHQTSTPTLDRIVDRIGDWRDRDVAVAPLQGGLANLNYLIRVDDETFVVKVITQQMDEFGLMIPIEHLLENTVAAGSIGVGARVIRSLPDIPALVLEYIDGTTLSTADLAKPEYIPRIGQAIHKLHTAIRPFANRIAIWDFLDQYLARIDENSLPTPAGLRDALPLVTAIREALQATAMPDVASHNDLLPLNLMDDGAIRLIDYDFSGASDPCFDLGDVAMEGLYSPDDTARLCESYFGASLADKVARVRLFGIIAQYTWACLFIGMDQLLTDKPADQFDYWAEAVSRWEWASAQLGAPDLGELVDRLRR